MSTQKEFSLKGEDKVHSIAEGLFSSIAALVVARLRFTKREICFESNAAHSLSDTRWSTSKASLSARITPNLPLGFHHHPMPSSIGSSSLRCRGYERRRHLRDYLRRLRLQVHWLKEVSKPHATSRLQHRQEKDFSSQMGDSQLRL